MSLVSDSKGLEDKKDPDTCNIMNLYKLFANEDQIKKMEENYRRGGYGYGHAKQALFELMWDYFAPFRKRREELLADPGYVEEILKKGGEKARETADATMKEVKKAVGLR